MLDDSSDNAATLTDILVFARSHPSLEELLAFFTSRVPSLLDCDRVEVRPGPAGRAPDARDGATSPHISSHPVSCGPDPWGELHLTYVAGPPSPGETRRALLLAEVLGAALVSAGSGAGATGTAADVAPQGLGGLHPDPDDMVALVLECAEALDLMPEASTRARLALVVGRLAGAVGASSWSVALAHNGRLHEVASAGVPMPGDVGLGGAAPAGSPALSGFPARLRASEGWAFYADRYTGDEAERRALLEADHTAVVGAGGYDLDGRSWVVEVFADTGARLEHVTAVLFAVVLAALSFPREAVVPRPQEAWVRGIVNGPGLGRSEAQVRGIGAAG